MRIIRSFFKMIKKYFDELTLLFLSAFLFMVATNTQSGWLYFVISFILGLLIFNIITMLLNFRKLSIRREPIPPMREDETGVVNLIVKNKSRLPKFFILIHEFFPTLHPDEKPIKVFVPYIPGGKEVKTSYKCKPYHRGIYSLGEIEVETCGILGFFAGSRKFNPGEDQLVVMPRIFDASRIALLNNSNTWGGGENTFVFSGRSHDFTGIREYCPGHEVRFVHWPSTAKHSQLMIKEFNEISSHSISVVIENLQGCDIGAGRETTMEHMIRAAATILKSASRERYTFNLYYSQNGCFCANRKIAPARGELMMAGISVQERRPTDGEMQRLSNILESADHLYVFKVFPFKNTEALRGLIQRNGQVTVVFFSPIPFLDEEDGILYDPGIIDYESQVNELREMGISAHVYLRDQGISHISIHNRGTMNVR